MEKKQDELPNPLEGKRRALREAGLKSVLNGDAKAVQKNGSTVVKVGKGYAPADAAAQHNKSARKARKGHAQKAKKVDQYVELKQERVDKIFVILAEFGNDRHPDYPDADTDPDTPGPTTFEGPVRNQIPEPDRKKDNSTIWQKDFNKKHFEDLYFGAGKKVESVSTYYKTQSSGRYSVDGTVSDWVKVRYNEARYGREDSGVWYLVQDAVNKWVADQEAAGKTAAQIKEALAAYDKYDRYDFDGDGDFNESDGYLDHFQILHAGGDEADGDPQQGEDAIWSHRWYAFVTNAGITGPDNNKLGGTQVGNAICVPLQWPLDARWPPIRRRGTEGRNCSLAHAPNLQFKRKASSGSDRQRQSVGLPFRGDEVRGRGLRNTHAATGTRSRMKSRTSSG